MLDDTATLPGYVFTEREQARLAIYRAAVRAGFYNEATPLSPRRSGARLEQYCYGLGTDLSASRG
jgi:hypothetical protein